MPVKFKEESRIVFIVKEYQRTRDFYEKTVGLCIVSEWDRTKGDRGVVYQLGSTHLEILEGDISPLTQGFYVYLEVEDIDALWERLSGTVEIVDAIGTRPWGHRNFSIKDPNGFTIKFFSRVA